MGDEDSFGNYPKKPLPSYYEMGPTGLGFNNWLARESHRSICSPVLGIASVCHYIPIFTWFLGIELKSNGLEISYILSSLLAPKSHSRVISEEWKHMLIRLKACGYPVKCSVN